MLSFFLFRKSISDVFQSFALINKQVANQPIEIHFSKGDQKKKKKNVLGSSFRVLFLQTPPQSPFAKQIPPEMAGVCLFVYFFFLFGFSFLLFFDKIISAVSERT